MIKRKQLSPCSSSMNFHCFFIIAGSRLLLRRKISQIELKNGFKVFHCFPRNSGPRLRPRSPPELVQLSQKKATPSPFPVQLCLRPLLKFSRNRRAKSNVEPKKPNLKVMMMSMYHPLARLEDWTRTRTTPRNGLLLRRAL